MGVDLKSLAEITAASLVTLQDLFGVALEVLRLFPLAHLAAGVIMAVITILPLADIAAALAVWSAIFLAVLAELQRRRTPGAWLLPLAGCVRLAGGLHAVHIRQSGVHCLQSNFRVQTLQFASAGMGPPGFSCLTGVAGSATSAFVCQTSQSCKFRWRPHS